MPTQTEDEKWMERCLQLARRGIGQVSPNPAVGAVLVAGGKIVADGFHRTFGGPHAEVACLTRFRWPVPRDAVLYVNLEPCAHHGKTPACVDLIRKAGVRNVVIGMVDPNPLVSGRGISELRKAGINVTTGVLENRCVALNRPFQKNITTGLPYILLKVAMSIDGKLAAGQRWISSKQSRLRVHRARAAYDAVLVGSGTVISDNPRLDVRFVHGRNPRVVVLDGRLRSPANSRVFSQLPRREVILCTSSATLRKKADKVRRLRDKGIRVIGFEPSGGRLPLRKVCRTLSEMNIGSILIEGGVQLSGAFFAAGLVDELSAFVAPSVFGGSHGAFRVDGKALIRQANRHIGRVFTKRVGPDLEISYQYN